MRKHRLGILALVSIFIAGVLLVGYFGVYGINYAYNRGGFGDGYGEAAVCLWRGDMRIGYFFSEIGSTEPTGVMFIHSASNNPSPFVAAFDGLGFGSASDQLKHWRIPIWCILLPCSIAPILWLRKRRRAKARGFPVEPAPPSV